MNKDSPPNEFSRNVSCMKPIFLTCAGQFANSMYSVVLLPEDFTKLTVLGKVIGHNNIFAIKMKVSLKIKFQQLYLSLAIFQLQFLTYIRLDLKTDLLKYIAEILYNYTLFS